MNIYTGLLFLQGHILRADDLVPPAPTGLAEAAEETPVSITVPDPSAAVAG